MIDDKIIEGLREYLKDNYFPEHSSVGMGIAACSKLIDSEVLGYGITMAESISRMSFRNVSDDASKYIKRHRKPGGFSHALDGKRKEKGLTPAELYKRANVDRRHYSRLMGPEGRHPSINTVICFALALKLDRKEFDDFLQTAGYALSNSSSRDVCIMYCIENNIYEVNDVNTLLFTIGIEPLTRDA